ncbi:uncharacterized protein LOC132259074 [Phlebotomus argentipes]|uniref:uncharacterized protein LOC132259074 n=1 Tax=Phlebotomus argentipes TaxID=94469 RepID=UPI0028937827|nr:uncharacterized protein LOC132259074 [Phlebotomus argentipes]
MAGVKDRMDIQTLSNWKMPENFMPDNISSHSEGFSVSNSKRIIKFSGDPEYEPNPSVEELENLEDKEVLGCAKRQNGSLIFRRRLEEEYYLIFCDNCGDFEQEIHLNDFLAEDFIKELNFNGSQLECITITAENVAFLSKFLNIDESEASIGREIVLISAGSALNVVQKNEEDEWDASMHSTYANSIESVWFSGQFQAIFVLTSLRVLEVTFLMDGLIKRQTMFLGKKYLTVPKIVREDELLGITLASLDLLTIAKKDNFFILTEKVNLPGVVDGIYHEKWRCYVVMTENRLIYALRRTKSQAGKKIDETLLSNAEIFRKQITALTDESLRIMAEAREDAHILNCLGFLRNFSVATHSVTLKVSLRQSLGDNVELTITPSEQIAQMNVSDSQWSLSVFNECFRQKFALKPSTDSYAFMLPQKWLKFPLRVDIAVEFSLDGEHFSLAFPLRVIFTSEGAAQSPLADFYGKLEALHNSSGQQFGDQWREIEQLSEKKLCALAMKLQRMIVEGKLESQDVLEVHRELRSKALVE